MKFFMLRKLLLVIGIVMALCLLIYFPSAVSSRPSSAGYFPFTPNPGATIKVTLQGYLYNAVEPQGEFNLYFTSQEEILTHCTVAIDGQHMSITKVRFKAPYYNGYLNEATIKMNDQFSLGQNYDESSYGSPSKLPQHVKLLCLQGHIDWNTDFPLANKQQP